MAELIKSVPNLAFFNIDLTNCRKPHSKRALSFKLVDWLKTWCSQLKQITQLNISGYYEAVELESLFPSAEIIDFSDMF